MDQLYLIISLSFAIGFFIESIVGFGGGLIAYFFLGFVTDLKTMILAGLYIGTCSSIYIMISDYKNFNHKILLRILIFAAIGTIIGCFAFSFLSEKILSSFFAIILIILSVKIIFFDNITLPKILKNKLLLIGGISHGAFGIGGPFWVNALKNDFKNKSELRTTMAAIFVFFNIIRVIQLTIQQELSNDFIGKVWWTIIPVFIAIKLGHYVHLKISEEIFKKLIGAITLFAGLKFIIKAFI
jgi:uncharacterized membrane protein YfcA